MIQANELRIGNWIKDRGGKEWQIDNWESPNKVSAKEPEFNTCGMLLKGHPFTEYVNFLQPIPLDESWLIRAGFSVITESSAGKRYGYVINGVFSSDLTLIFWKTTENAGKFFRSNLEIKFVHQLQNLFFALTGTELTFKD